MISTMVKRSRLVVLLYHLLLLEILSMLLLVSRTLHFINCIHKFLSVRIFVNSLLNYYFTTTHICFLIYGAQITPQGKSLWDQHSCPYTSYSSYITTMVCLVVQWLTHWTRIPDMGIQPGYQICFLP